MGTIETMSSHRCLPDAELLRLGQALDTASAAENAAFAAELGEEATEVLVERSAEIVRQIEALPAATLAGVLVKTRALAWSRLGDPFDADDLGGGQPTTDVRLVISLIRDLRAIASQP